MNAEEAARMIHGYAILLPKKHTLQFLEYPIWEQESKVTSRFHRRFMEGNGGTGALNFGAIPYRDAEVMRYVPEINKEEQDAAINAILRAQRIAVELFSECD